jgi:hypothetical protein
MNIKVSTSEKPAFPTCAKTPLTSLVKCLSVSIIEFPALFSDSKQGWSKSYSGPNQYLLKVLLLS